MHDRHGKVLLSLALVMFVVFAARAAFAQDVNAWPQWRGPLATGEAPGSDPPTSWSQDTNIRWKTRLPGRGSASPIVWGDLIFIQTAIVAGQSDVAAPASDASTPPAQGQRRGGMRAAAPTDVHQFTLLCLDRRTGNILWQKVAREELPHEGHHPDHGFASHSPVTDGQHVYAYFGSRGLHCYDVQGNLKWSKDLGRMQTRNSFGEGSSPALHGDTLVIIWDHQGEDFIAAFDKNSGDELWRTPRNEDQTWATPLVIEHNGQAQVVAIGQRKVRSYDLKTGRQVWESPGLTANPIPTPVAGHGMVYTTSGFRGAALFAVKLGRSGDLANTDAIAWSAAKGTPYVPSPLLYGNRLYIFSGNNNILSVFDALSGKVIIDTQRVEGLDGVYSSPVGAAGRVYLVGRNGTTVVIKHLDPSETIEVLSTNVLGERIDASPAVLGKELLLRGHEHLYCIAEGP